MTFLEKVRLLLSSDAIILHYCTVEKDLTREITETILDEALDRHDSNMICDLSVYTYESVIKHVKKRFVALQAVLERDEKINNITKI